MNKRRRRLFPKVGEHASVRLRNGAIVSGTVTKVNLDKMSYQLECTTTKKVHFYELLAEQTICIREDLVEEAAGDG
jgi:hypothetical protein